MTTSVSENQEFTEKIRVMTTIINNMQKQLDKIRDQYEHYPDGNISVNFAGCKICFQDKQDITTIMSLVEQLATRRIDTDLQGISKIINMEWAGLDEEED